MGKIRGGHKKRRWKVKKRERAKREREEALSNTHVQGRLKSEVGAVRAAGVKGQTTEGQLTFVLLKKSAAVTLHP